MSGYPLGSPELRQHIHDVVEVALWPWSKSVAGADGALWRPEGGSAVVLPTPGGAR